MSVKALWNTRYVRFAISQGRTALDQLAFDKVKPGACMISYILWSSEHWTLFAKESGISSEQARFKHTEYDQWLAERYPGPE